MASNQEAMQQIMAHIFWPFFWLAIQLGVLSLAGTVFVLLVRGLFVGILRMIFPRLPVPRRYQRPRGS